MSKNIINIVGCMGIGKTTLINNIRKKYPCLTYVEEPVDIWLNLKDQSTGKNLLDTFYSDKKRWSYTFENIAFITRLSRIMKSIEADQSGTILLDGCLATDKNIYSEMLHDEGYISNMEWEAYKLWNTFYEEHVKQHNIIYIYLRCDPQTILQRIKSRARDGESNIDISYLTNIQNYLDKWSSSPTIQSHVKIYNFDCSMSDTSYDNIITEITKNIRVN